MNVHLHCPHCKNPIELLDLQPNQEVTCAACGSSFRLEDISTTHWTAERKQVGRFEILGEVGHGGFGTVYKARDPQLDRTVAIKVPRRGNIGDEPQDLDRFLREARSVAQLRHHSTAVVAPIRLPAAKTQLADGHVARINERQSNSLSIFTRRTVCNRRLRRH
ncbi:MAG: hypothetical protein L0Y72_22415 [Gemmataceae bacterium]|nr:hypothetical protein [Gemmataceae bacterium]MCI0741797.1 hypothetical protein [Gemmataceae bacterium]